MSYHNEEKKNKIQNYNDGNHSHSHTHNFHKTENRQKITLNINKIAEK